MKKDYEINEGIFIIYNSLKALRSEYQFQLPKDVKDKTDEYLCYLGGILEKDFENLDIVNNKLIDRVYFKDE